MGLRDRVVNWLVPQQRSILPMTLYEWSTWFQGQLGPTYSMPSDPQQEIDAYFESRVRQAYESNGVVFACMLARFMLFSEARFQFRQRRGGRPGDLFGSPDLAIFEEPWGPGSTTGDLLGAMITDADLAGSAFVARLGSQLRVMQPDWVSIIFDQDPRMLKAKIVGYSYQAGGKGSDIEPDFLLPEQVAHFMPIRDPLAPYRGMSWITPIAREIMADSATRDHKLKFFENGATPNLVVKVPADTLEKFDAWVSKFSAKQEGVRNAYKTLFIAAGAEATAVGTNLQQLDFKVTQGAGETRIAAASGMHPIVVALSEGLQGSSLNEGNFQAAARLSADKTLRPLWRNAAGTLSKLVNVPAASELWYDDRDIPFLADDQKDAAEIQRQEAESINRLISAGYKPDAVIDAVKARDFSRLSGQHTGLFSVQLQPPLVTMGDLPAAQPQPPRAIPLLTTSEWRCENCDRKLAEERGAGTRIRCRCGHLNEAEALGVAS